METEQQKEVRVCEEKSRGAVNVKKKTMKANQSWRNKFTDGSRTAAAKLIPGIFFGRCNSCSGVTYSMENTPIISTLNVFFVCCHFTGVAKKPNGSVCGP